ncbi:helix-turn-helix domain-containing protein [Siphonobacter curvatus]|nr:helix-turn-helix transcriptional regulator [Siphonobacter curvatus]
MLKVLGNNIAYLRGVTGLSQQDLSSYLKINRVELSYYENGQRSIPMTKLRMLADLVGIEPMSLYDESFAKRPLQTAFAFRSNGFEVSDLETIADFQRIARNYLRFKRLSENLSN